MKVFGGFIAAIRTLTIIGLPGDESKELSDSLSWFPIVGLGLGLVIYVIGFLWGLFPFEQWTGCAALLMVVAEVWLTRGLHLDGLADWADSIGGFPDREKRLAVMKDVSLGTFGVLALIMAVLAKWLAFERLLYSRSGIWLLLIFALSRGAMVDLITSLPYARIGEGMGRPFVEGASLKHRFTSLFLCLLFSIPFGPLGLALFGLAWLMTWVFGTRCRRNFGGITGDLLGTANEMVEVSLLMICALPGKNVLYYTGWKWIF